MKKFIVITSINEPTRAVKEFAKWDGWTTVVVGDNKTPDKWEYENVVYLSLRDQAVISPELSALIPENSYLRKMIGYVYAAQNGADFIFETDDDNIPYKDAQQTIEAHTSQESITQRLLSNESDWHNVYGSFGAEYCWPRGYPLQLLGKQDSVESKAKVNWGVIQYLADIDPDVDAIYRMTVEREVYFARQKTIALSEGTFCPFNSQATLWSKAYFPLMFLPLGVADRVTDILRGYIAQRSLWAENKQLNFCSPVVFQDRNEHNLLNDFQQEIPLYENAEVWCKKISDTKAESSLETYTASLQTLIDDGYLNSSNKAAYEKFVSCIQVRGE